MLTELFLVYRSLHTSDILLARPLQASPRGVDMLVVHLVYCSGGHKIYAWRRSTHVAQKYPAQGWLWKAHPTTHRNV